MGEGVGGLNVEEAEEGLIVCGVVVMWLAQVSV